MISVTGAWKITTGAKVSCIGIGNFNYSIVITSASTVSNAENSTLAFSLAANMAVTWSIIGGSDATRFEISGSTLRWVGNGTKDFEAPNDSDLNNIYVVQVQAVASGYTATQTITVTVTDVAEIAFDPATSSKSPYRMPI